MTDERIPPSALELEIVRRYAAELRQAACGRRAYPKPGTRPAIGQRAIRRFPQDHIAQRGCERIEYGKHHATYLR